MLSKYSENGRRQVQQVGDGYIQEQYGGGVAQQLSNGRGDGALGNQIAHLERPGLPNSGAPNSGVFNPTPLNPLGGFISGPRGQTGVQSGVFGESGAIPTGRMRLCRNGQQCNVNGCTFSYTPINKTCRS